MTAKGMICSRLLTSLPRAALHTSAMRSSAVAGSFPLPARRPMGAFRSGLFGFFLGSTLAGTGAYTYLLSEYRASNQLLTEDIYLLNASVERVLRYMNAIEVRIDQQDTKDIEDGRALQTKQ